MLHLMLQDGRVVCTAQGGSTAGARHTSASHARQHRRQRKHKAHKHRRKRGGGGDDAAADDDTGAEHATPAANHTQHGTMQLHRLDALVAEDVQVLKVDVDGFEPLVLAGADGKQL